VAFFADVLVVFLRLVTRVFFRAVEVTGREHVPSSGPVIFVGNHPNSLLDPVMVLTTCGRPVRFAAKDVLFRGPLRPFLDALGCVPVKRRQDQVKGAAEDGPVEGAPTRVDNSAAFDALLGVLHRGEAFGIFPEGISHTRPELAPLKTGAARIALMAAAQGITVRVVPVGLHYRRRDRMRSRVLVQFGAPIVVPTADADDDGAANDGSADRVPDVAPAAARALTTSIEAALRAQTINTPDFDTLRVLEGVRRLYRPDHIELSLADQTELLRRFIDSWERLRGDAEVASLYRDVETYQHALRALGLVDDDLRAGGTSRLVRLERLSAHAFFLLVDVPLAIPGIVLHAPVIATAILAGAALTSRGDVRATIKVVVATALTLLTYVVAGVVAFFARGGGLVGVGVAFAVVLALLMSGNATIRVLERQAELRRGFATFVALLHLDREIERLAAERERLRARLLAVVSRHAGNIERIINDEDHGDKPWLDDDDGL
jgi:1-acyl-sn-glycerol-3-phosphate acyltransferase